MTSERVRSSKTIWDKPWLLQRFWCQTCSSTATSLCCSEIAACSITILMVFFIHDFCSGVIEKRLNGHFSQWNSHGLFIQIFKSQPPVQAFLVFHCLVQMGDFEPKVLRKLLEKLLGPIQWFSRFGMGKTFKELITPIWDTCFCLLMFVRNSHELPVRCH